jgi:hypothetical protein
VIISQSHAQNFFNKSTRDQATKIYAKECEVALLNKQGPGPGYYDLSKAEIRMSGEKEKFSIPQVSYLFLIFR